MTMEPAKSREQRLFEAALRLEPGAERQAFLQAACATDAELRVRLEQLLATASEADAFFEKDPLEQAGVLEKPVPPAAQVAPLTQTAGQRIGRYKLLEQIGEGGLGMVYMAEQEEPVRRRVALKIIKPGMDTRSVIARFEAERQALALMDHPNVARILDGGVTEDGRPYFVMDLIQGAPVTQFCDAANLNAAQRLALFVEICAAVQHAHQKGIIHRDLKPSNILVTLHGDKPVPKIIDFGIAKATEQRLTEKTLFTQFQQFIGTPAYMSPEQASLSGLDIDTRSDIYSLGVLLYELLTGKTPFDAKELLKAGVDEMRRTIREKEPERPSTRVSALTREELTTTAKRRGLDPSRLVNLLRGDLDWIVIKCLEKDRARRYATANGLAKDIERHLKNEPVSASPPSNFYRFQKFVRRNKLIFAATCAVITCLIIALGGAAWALIKERQARRASEALRLEQQTQLEKAQAIAVVYKARQLYMQRRRDEAERMLNEIPASTLVPDPLHANLRRHLAWWHAIHQDWSGAASNLAMVTRLNKLDRLDDISEDLFRQAVVSAATGDSATSRALRDVVLAPDSLQSSNPFIAGLTCRTCLLRPAGDDVLSRLGKLYETLVRAKTGTTKVWALQTMALVDYRRDDFPKAIAECEEVLAIPSLELNPRFQAHISLLYPILAMAHHQLHHDQEARAALVRARELSQSADLSASDASTASVTLDLLFKWLYGVVLTREAAILVEGSVKQDGSDYAATDWSLGNVYLRGWDGEVDLAEAIKWYRIAAQYGSNEAKNSVAWLQATCRNPKIRDGTNAVRLAEAAVAATNRKVPSFLDTLGAAYAETGQFEKALAVQREALALKLLEPVRKDLEAHLKLYEASSPLRE